MGSPGFVWNVFGVFFYCLIFDGVCDSASLWEHPSSLCFIYIMTVWARMSARVLRSLGLINSAAEDPSCPKGIRKVAWRMYTYTYPYIYTHIHLYPHMTSWPTYRTCVSFACNWWDLRQVIDNSSKLLTSWPKYRTCVSFACTWWKLRRVIQVRQSHLDPDWRLSGSAAPAARPLQYCIQ